MNRFLFSLILAACALPTLAQTNAPSSALPPATNPAPTAVVTEPAMSSTNAVPTAATNAAAPVATPPRKTVAVNGAALMGAFGGASSFKSGISGRVLRLPPPDVNAPPTPADAWRRALDFGMNMTEGNSDTLRYSLGLDVVKDREQDLIRLAARGSYGESAEKTDTENASALARYERKLSDAYYALGDVEWMNDRIADVDYRVTSILSPGVHVIRTDETILNLEVGAGYLAEKKGDVEQGFAAARLAVALERILNTHVLTWCAAEYVPKVVDANVFFINAEIGITSVLARNLNLNVSLQDRYDNAPVEDKKSNDSQLATTLCLRF